MKNISRLFLVVLTVLTLQTRQASASDESFSSYVNVGVGALMPFGTAYDGYNTRFQVGAEVGGQMFALPVSISFGQGINIYSIKPRIQYFFAPFAAVPGLFVGPGVGAVINYEHGSGTAFGTTADADILELGAQVSLQLQYRFAGIFHVQFTPVAFDMNFWRKGWVSAGGASGSVSDTDFGAMYGIMASAGLNF
jgi:hypothetical protein